MTTSQLAEQLSTRRKKLGLTQAYVAELAGISSRQLVKLETGQANPGFAQLQAVLTTLGLNLKVEVAPLP